MVYSEPRFASELALRNLGYQGQFGGGGGDAWLASNPGLAEAYRQQFQTITGSQQGPSATFNPALDSIVNNQGVQSAFVADMSPLQQAAVQSMADYEYTDPSETAIPVIQNIAAGNFDVSPFMNRYEDDVIAAVMDDIERQAEEARAKAADQAITYGQFGGTGQRNLDSEINSQMLRTMGRESANLRHGGFNSAVQALLNQQSRQVQAATALGGMGSNALDNFLRLNTARFNTGAAVQGQNQNVLSALEREFRNQQGFGAQQLDSALSRVLPFGQATAQPQAFSQPSALQRMVGGAGQGFMIGQNVADALPTPMPQTPYMMDPELPWRRVRR